MASIFRNNQKRTLLFLLHINLAIFKGGAGQFAGSHLIRSVFLSCPGCPNYGDGSALRHRMNGSFALWRFSRDWVDCLAHHFGGLIRLMDRI
jgi:hypothetical protein